MPLTCDVGCLFVLVLFLVVIVVFCIFVVVVFLCVFFCVFLGGWGLFCFVCVCFRSDMTFAITDSTLNIKNRDRFYGRLLVRFSTDGIVTDRLTEKLCVQITVRAVIPSDPTPPPPFPHGDAEVAKTVNIVLF